MSDAAEEFVRALEQWARAPLGWPITNERARLLAAVRALVGGAEAEKPPPPPSDAEGWREVCEPPEGYTVAGTPAGWGWRTGASGTPDVYPSRLAAVRAAWAHARANPAPAEPDRPTGGES